MLGYLSYVAYMPFFCRGPSITFAEFHKGVYAAIDEETPTTTNTTTATRAASVGGGVKKKREGRKKDRKIRCEGTGDPRLERRMTTARVSFTSRFCGYDGVAYMVIRTLVCVACINASVHLFYYPTLLFLGLDDVRR